MIWAALVLGMLTGLDNLQAASAIGMLPLTPTRRWHVALTFALFEAGMPVLGVLLGAQLVTRLGGLGEWVAPVCLACCGALILLLALRERSAAAVANSRLLLFGLPLSLSFDNLLAGVGIGALGLPLVPAALVVGLVSGAMSLAGMLVGARIRNLVPDHIELVSGAWLLCSALVMVVLDR